MTEEYFLARYPYISCDVKARPGSEQENRAIASKFDKEYFDGTVTRAWIDTVTMKAGPPLPWRSSDA